MDDMKKDGNLPDISGVFNIDENSIPNVIIARDSDRAEHHRDYEPILLSDPAGQKKEKKERKKLKRLKKEEQLAQKRKKLKQRAIICLVFAAVVAAAVFGIKTAVDCSRRPLGTITTSCTGSVAAHYDTKAVLTTDVSESGKVRTVAVFSENDYDVYSVSTGLSAVITVEEGVTAQGTVTSIERETSDSPVMEKIREAFPDGEYSAGINYVITVETDLDANIQDGIIADVSITTAVSDNTVTVPSTAVHKSDARAYVWIYKPFSHTAQRREVSVGISADGISEITKGLKADERIVAVFSCEDSELGEKLKIKVNKNEQNTPDETEEK